MPLRCVYTDLDGTLWANEGRVSSATRAALTELEGRGIPVLAATGRRLRSARLALMRAELAHLPCVGLNGALAADGGTVFHASAFATGDAHEVYDHFVAGGIIPVGYLVPPRDPEANRLVA